MIRRGTQTPNLDRAMDQQSFTMPDVHKTLNLNISGYINNIIIKR